MSDGSGRRIDALLRRVSRLEGPSADAPSGPAPYDGTFLDFLADADLTGPTWTTWTVFWKAVDAVPLTPAELGIFQRHTGRSR